MFKHQTLFWYNNLLSYVAYQKEETDLFVGQQSAHSFS